MFVMNFVCVPTEHCTHERAVARADVRIAGNRTSATRATNESVVGKSAKCAKHHKHAEFKPMKVHHS